MLRTSAYSLLGASALVLGGCTIYTNSRPATYQAPRAQSVPARRTTVTRAPSVASRVPASPTVNSVPSTATTDTSPGTTGAGIRGPRITSPIIFGNGQGGAFTGEAFVIPTGTTRLPNLSDFVPFATLFTDTFEVKSQVFSGGFPGALRQDDWFAIRFEGDFLSEIDGVAEFALTSDDGAVLSIDGQKLIDNDGAHTTATVNGRRSLTRGAHHLRLDYFQGTRGQVALSLDVLQGGGKSTLGGFRPLQGINRTAPRR
jgi:PA14 domain